MPNHVENVLSIDGPQAFEAASKYFRTLTDEDGKPYGPTFDFNVLIPMPPVAAEVTEDGTTPDVLALLSESSGMADIWERLRKFDRNCALGPWPGLFNFDRGEMRERLEKFQPGIIARARTMARCIGETGFKSWYDWAIANWGTKWNAYSAKLDGSGDHASMHFQTAWDVPLPVLRALAKAEPALSFKYHAFDEGWNFYAVGSGAAGDMIVEKRRELDRKDPATVEVYKICYGEEPDQEDDE